MALISGTSGELMRTMASVASYKSGQGVWARRITTAVIVITVVMGGWTWFRTFSTSSIAVRLVPAAVLGAAGVWAAYRIVHYPRFADFLITTEAEMAKVSWPTWPEVKVSTIVVLVLAVLLGVYLFAVDWFWQHLLHFIRVLEFRGGALGDNA